MFAHKLEETELDESKYRRLLVWPLYNWGGVIAPNRALEIATFTILNPSSGSRPWAASSAQMRVYRTSNNGIRMVAPLSSFLRNPPFPLLMIMQVRMRGYPVRLRSTVLGAVHNTALLTRLPPITSHGAESHRAKISVLNGP